MQLKLNNNLKHYFVGISLSPASNTETGIAVLDSNLKIILLDKAFSVQDLFYFFDNFNSKKNSIISVSLASDVTMLNSKWKVLAKKFQLLHTSKNLHNRQNWTGKYTNRGAELFLQYKQQDIDIIRFDLIELKKALGIASFYKDRSPLDCKYLQSVLKFKFLLEDIPSNMLPASQIEAILGALLAYKVYIGKQDEDYKILYEYKKLPVVNLLYGNECVV